MGDDAAIDGVELLPVIHPQANHVPAEKNQPLLVLSGALHRCKTA